MNYFEVIYAIRGERDDFYSELLASEMERNEMTCSLVQLKRRQLAQGIQAKYKGELGSLKGKNYNGRGGTAKKKFNLKSRQHDEYAVVNFYMKTSKYDLDRANLNVATLYREKIRR